MAIITAAVVAPLIGATAFAAPASATTGPDAFAPILVRYSHGTTIVPVPFGATSAHITAVGGAGGSTLCHNGGFGGGGTKVSGTVPVNYGQQLLVSPGGRGRVAAVTDPDTMVRAAGGWGLADTGGGQAESRPGMPHAGANDLVAAGGGATVVDLNGSRVVVAAGGGGAGACTAGYHGGFGGSNGDGHNAGGYSWLTSPAGSGGKIGERSAPGGGGSVEGGGGGGGVRGGGAGRMGHVNRSGGPSVMSTSIFGAGGGASGSSSSLLRGSAISGTGAIATNAGGDGYAEIAFN